MNRLKQARKLIKKRFNKVALYTLILLLAVVLSANTPGVIVSSVNYFRGQPDQQNLQQLISQSGETNRDRANNLTIQGWQLYEKGTIESLNQALEILQSARKLWQQVGDKQAEARAVLGIGRVYADLGQKQLALEHYQQMLTLSRSVGDHRIESTAINNIGRVYEDLGEKQKALDNYQQALEIAKQNRDQKQQASILVNIGRVFGYFGDQQKAIDLQNQALSLFRELKDIDGQIIALNSLGQAYFDLQDRQKAMEFYEQALSLLSQTDNKRGMATTWNNLGQLHFELGKIDKAIDCFHQALETWQQIGDKSGAASSLNNIGAVYRHKGKLPEALSYFQQALSLTRTVSDRSLEANTLANIAQVQHQQGQLETSQQNMENAIAIIEDLRSQIRSQDYRITYFASKKGLYDFYIDVLMDLHQKYPQKGYAAQALQASENSRARGLIELLTEAHGKIRTQIDPQLLAEENRIKFRLEAVNQQLQSIPDTPEGQPQTTYLRQEINTLVAEYKNLQTKIRSQSPNYGQLMYPKPLNLQEIQQQLDKDTVLLQYSLGRDRSYLWTVSPNSFQSYILPPSPQIQINAEKFRTGVQITTPDLPNQVIDTAQQLSQTIIAPAINQIKDKRLVIVGDGILQQIPFATLPDPQVKNKYQPLMVNHEIINLPSATTIAIQRRQITNRQPAPNLIAILADPVYTANDERVTGKPAPAQIAANLELEQSVLKRSARAINGQGFPRLPFTLQEAESILQLIPNATGLKATSFDANYDFATSPTLSQYRILHFATHGFVDNDNPELSGLVLSLVDQQGQPRRGYLQLADLYNLNYPADLIVLSACETGLGKEVRGEGLVGLTRGLMYAGGARIVISLWQVSDEGTAELMREFYQQMLGNKQTPAAALRNAQIKLWQQGDYRSPYFWAGFTIQGEWL